MRRVPVNSVVRKSVMFSNVIVDIAFPRRSFVFSQSNCEVLLHVFVFLTIKATIATIQLQRGRKPTHTDRLLDESSYNPTSHKATTIRTLTRRAQLVCNTTDSLSDENKYLNRVFSKNNYNEDFIQRNTHRPTSTAEANDNATPTTTATITYKKGHI